MVIGGVLEAKGTSPAIIKVRGVRFGGKRDLPSALFEVGWGRFRGKRDLFSTLFEVGKGVLEAKESSHNIICGWRGEF